MKKVKIICAIQTVDISRLKEEVDLTSKGEFWIELGPEKASVYLTYSDYTLHNPKISIPVNKIKSMYSSEYQKEYTDYLKNSFLKGTSREWNAGIGKAIAYIFHAYKAQNANAYKNKIKIFHIASQDRKTADIVLKPNTGEVLAHNND